MTLHQQPASPVWKDPTQFCRCTSLCTKGLGPALQCKYCGIRLAFFQLINRHTLVLKAATPLPKRREKRACVMSVACALLSPSPTEGRGLRTVALNGETQPALLFSDTIRSLVLPLKWGPMLILPLERSRRTKRMPVSTWHDFNITSPIFVSVRTHHQLARASKICKNLTIIIKKRQTWFWLTEQKQYFKKKSPIFIERDSVQMLYLTNTVQNNTQLTRFHGLHRKKKLENKSQKQLLFNSAHFCTRRKESLYTLFNFILKYFFPLLFFFLNEFFTFFNSTIKRRRNVAEKTGW